MRWGWIGVAAALTLAGCNAPAERSAETATTDAATSATDSYAAPPPPPPPVAPPPPAMAAPSGADAMAVTGSRAALPKGAAAAGRDRAESMAPPAMMPRPPYPFEPDTQRYGQSGLLTAGDHDDLLNPGLYARYVERTGQGDYRRGRPFLDTRRTLTVAVRGRDGRPAAFVPVSARRTDGSRLTLTTAANGEAVLHPAYDRLIQGFDLTVDGVRQQSGRGRRLDVTLPRSAGSVRAFDLVVVVDTTGSMGDELGYLQAELTDVLADVARANPGVSTRVGLVFYRDEGDEYVVRSFPFTGDVGTMQASLNAQAASGGGDYPEAMHRAVARAVDYPWRDGATKAVLLVADAPPHEQDVDATWSAANAARLRGVHIVPVAASGVAQEAEYLMRAMAALTQSRYLFLTDDSGVGNAHAEPDVACYVVTRLDSLVRRVLSGLVAGRRIEPSPAEVIRRVGHYDRGVCRADRQWQSQYDPWRRMPVPVDEH